MRHIVAAPVSLGACIARLFPAASGRTRKLMLRRGRVRVNGTVARSGGTALASGAVVEIGAKAPRSALPPTLAVVYEDEEIVVIDKPAGLLSIATARERDRTAYAYLTTHVRMRTPPRRVFVVHRLDRFASGLLVFATSIAAKQALQVQFAAHTVERTYLAVVEGRPGRAAGSIASRLVEATPGRVHETRDPGRGRAGVTHWRVRRTGAHHTLLEVHLETGRRNQVRVHLAGRGHPIAGDATYGGRTDPLGRLALHAHVLGFDHPRTGARLRFVSPAPAGFAKL